MPQTKYDIKVADQATADEIINKTEAVTGVKFVNVNIDHGSIVVTHSDDYDEAAFKAAVGL